MRRAVLAGAALVLLVTVGVVVATRGGNGDGRSAEPFEGTWDVSLVVGAVDADPGADPAAFPGDATFRERWVFEECDAASCTLRRPDGGLLLGDLDGVRFTFTTVNRLDDEERFVGEAAAGETAAPADDEHADPCATTATRRFTARIEVGVRDRVLSGTVLRRPDARRVAAGGTTCYGLDLTLGFSGVPASGDTAASGRSEPSG